MERQPRHAGGGMAVGINPRTGPSGATGDRACARPWHPRTRRGCHGLPTTLDGAGALVAGV
jgi:hypothetical protein